MEAQVNYLALDAGVKIVFKQNSNLWIEIIEISNSHHRFNISRTKFEKGYPVLRPSTNYTIKAVLESVASWSTDLDSWIEESSYEDPWKKLYEDYQLPKQLSSGIIKIDFDSQTTFDDEEKALISSDLHKSKQYARDLDLPPDRIKILEEKIDQLIELSEKQEKTTWKTIAKEVIVNTIINVATDLNTFHGLYSLFGHLFKMPISRIS